MAPLSLMFGRHTLADVHVPVLLYSGDGDKLVAVDKNAAALARKLPEPPDFKLLAGAGHFVFMAPCDSDQLAAMPAIITPTWSTLTNGDNIESPNVAVMASEIWIGRPYRLLTVPRRLWSL